MTASSMSTMVTNLGSSLKNDNVHKKHLCIKSSKHLEQLVEEGSVASTEDQHIFLGVVLEKFIFVGVKKILKKMIFHFVVSKFKI